MARMSKIAMGATGLALAAGAVAAGAALTNKNTRKTLQRTAKKTVKGLKRVRDVMEEGQHRYQAFQHRIAKVKTKKGKRG